MNTEKRYSPEVQERAVQMVLDYLPSWTGKQPAITLGLPYLTPQRVPRASDLKPAQCPAFVAFLHIPDWTATHPDHTVATP